MQKKIVLVEPNLFFMTKILGSLRRLGYSVDCETTYEGIKNKVGSDVSAVIIDLAVQGLNAALIIRNLKNSPETKRIPVIGFCGHSEYALIENAKSAGCDLVTTNGQISSNLAAVINQVSQS